LALVYLRAAQAYMLISMPTCTSTILGVFQVIGGLHWIGVMLTPGFNVGSARKQRKVEQRRTVRVLQVRQPKFRSWARPLLSWTSFCTIHESTENRFLGWVRAGAFAISTIATVLSRPGY
jgi:hypothetical protein